MITFVCEISLKFGINLIEEMRFLGYYCGTQEYEALTLSEPALTVVIHDIVDSQQKIFEIIQGSKQLFIVEIMNW